ncbi:MAG: carbohydrate ABC transporter permease, partial [Lachnospiraceae bacterium]|nr:carbohydrate ABC transporter permease [Lachnospiraceae bacterium]
MKLFKASISRRKRRELIQIAIITVFAVMFAVVFLTPIVLTITNSFMSQTEINANYGAIFAKTEKGGKIFISEKVNLKFIPDMISFSQYITVLLKSPAYLIKFWNSVILVLPILVFQLAVAVFASYGFMRAKGKLKEIIFFTYIILMLMPYQVMLVPNYLVSNWF